MPNVVLVGAQWGDEGKGKIIDVLTRDVSWVVRFQGGSNAGHTVEVGEDKYILHLIPSGILRPGKKCIIGHGVVVDPISLLREIDGLERRGIRTAKRLFISERAHVVFPYHRLLDEHREGAPAAGARLGTTKRGIGPTYADKASRVGLRMGDLVGPDFDMLFKARAEEAGRLLAAVGAPALDMEAVRADYAAAGRRLAPYVTDTITLLNDALDRGASALFEGAQGAMLDLDYGTYPFVTSSNSTAGGACTGGGIAPTRIDRVLGVVKAYTTRVGEGPFPTELLDETGDQLRKAGNEFGSTTGRPRRCGWFDAVIARHAVRINGIDSWAVTKLDVLDALPVLRVAVAYDLFGKKITTPPADARQLARCRPIYEEHPGWQTPTTRVRRFSDLPANARSYLRRLEQLTGARIRLLSLGPRRASTLRVGR